MLLELGVPFNRPVAKTGLFQTAHNNIPCMGGGGNQFANLLTLEFSFTHFCQTLFLLGLRPCELDPCPSKGYSGTS